MRDLGDNLSAFEFMDSNSINAVRIDSPGIFKRSNNELNNYMYSYMFMYVFIYYYLQIFI